MVMLVEMAIGDAYGAGFEYVPEKIVRSENNLRGYRQHQKHKTLKPGHYTDDTQMAIAITEQLLYSGWSRMTLAHRFVTTFKRDERPGYSGQFYAFLKSVSDGDEFLAKIKPNSNKSGGAMRAPPLGFCKDAEEMYQLADLQASLTHDTEDGKAAARASAFLAHYCIYKVGPVAEALDYLCMAFPGKIREWKGKVGAPGLESVSAAITAVSRNVRLSALLKDCVSFTGDVDTVAAIALAAASCSDEYEKDLPQVLIDGLERGTYGYDFLVNLDRQLLEYAQS